MKQTTVGIIGCGVIAKIYIGNIQKYYPKLKVRACADLSVEKARDMAEKYEIERACTVKELLDDRETDIVLNLTVPKAHYEINRQIILNGKHVYCEKPLALSSREAEELRELAVKNGVMLGCAPDTFLGPALQTCRKLIDEGWIGRPVFATANMVSYGVETWHPSPEFYYKPGGGPLWDMGPYYVTTLVSLLGPVEACGSFSNIGQRQRKIYSMPKRGAWMDVETPTHYSGILKFAGGVVANINMSFDVWQSSLPKLELYGTNGTLIVPDPNLFGGEVKLIRSERILDGAADGNNLFSSIPLPYRLPSDNMRGIGLLDMACAIDGRRENRAGADLACHVTEVLESLSVSGMIHTLHTDCHRPAPLAMGLDVGEINERGRNNDENRNLYRFGKE